MYYVRTYIHRMIVFSDILFCNGSTLDFEILFVYCIASPNFDGEKYWRIWCLASDLSKFSLLIVQQIQVVKAYVYKNSAEYTALYCTTTTTTTTTTTNTTTTTTTTTVGTRLVQLATVHVGVVTRAWLRAHVISVISLTDLHQPNNWKERCSSVTSVVMVITSMEHNPLSYSMLRRDCWSGKPLMCWDYT